MNGPPSAERLSELSFIRPIPKAVRDYGVALDPKILEPGDLLLISNKKSSWPASRIVEEQSKQFAPLHACWHHVAGSGGKFEICEATFSGVKSRVILGLHDRSLSSQTETIEKCNKRRTKPRGLLRSHACRKRVRFWKLMGIVALAVEW